MNNEDVLRKDNWREQKEDDFVAMSVTGRKKEQRQELWEQDDNEGIKRTNSEYI